MIREVASGLSISDTNHAFLLHVYSYVAICVSSSAHVLRLCVREYGKPRTIRFATGGEYVLQSRLERAGTENSLTEGLQKRLPGVSRKNERCRGIGCLV